MTAQVARFGADPRMGAPQHTCGNSRSAAEEASGDFGVLTFGLINKQRMSQGGARAVLPVSGERPPYRRRLSRNTACSPSRFQNHHGALNRSARPQALSATAFSILAPATWQSRRKSLIVQ